MIVLTTKDKEALSYIYELDEFKSFKKLCDSKRLKIAEQILNVNMADEGSAFRISMLQGQYNALEFILLEIKSIHKKMAKVDI
jgi:hypothetical protein